MNALIKKNIFLLRWILSVFCCVFFVSASVAAVLDTAEVDRISDKLIATSNLQTTRKITAVSDEASNAYSPVFVFVDTKVESYQALVKDIEAHSANKNTTIVYLDPERNGIQQITDALAKQAGIAAIHLLTHGAAGSIQLGNATLNHNTLDLYTTQLTAWRKSLSADADILLYGCNVSSTEAGLQFIKQVGDLTQAHVAASTNLTGAALLGGDWDLESHYGNIKTNIILSAQAQKSWNSTLAYTDYISIYPGGTNTQTFRDNSNVGSSFTITSGNPTLINKITVQLRALPGAATQTITACMRPNWNISTNEKCASMSSTALTTSFQWYVFDIGNFTVPDNVIHYVQIYSHGTDSNVAVNYNNGSLWGNSTNFFYNNNHPGGDSGKELYFVLSAGSNNAPTVANIITNKTAIENTAFNFQFASNTFSDTNSRDTLTYTATLSSNAALPAWLSFNASTRTFSGTPGSSDVGTIAVKVTANDGNGGTVSNTFNIAVTTNLSYYRISPATSPGSTCAGSAITISAYNSLDNLVAPANGTVITLTTSPATGSWVGGNTATFDGTVTSVTKTLQQTTASTLNINVTDGTHTESASYDPNLPFNSTTLGIYANSSAGSAIPNQVAGVVDSNPVVKVSNCTTRVSASSAPSVSFAYECRNPTSCVAGQSFTVNGVAAKANSNSSSISYSSSQSLAFNNAGVASIPIKYTDVGRVKLYATMTLPATATDPAVTLTANSGDFVVKPHTFEATTIQSNSSTPSANPGGTSSAGSSAQFVPAGTPFTVKVVVKNGEGNLTPNFGNETPSENLTFVARSLEYPSGGSLTAFTNPSVFTATTPAGTFINSTISWDQAGSIKARPELADNDYLGAGDIVDAQKTVSGTIGRFYPHHFAFTSSTANSCLAGGFSFMDQPAITFNYNVEAQGATNTVLTNYGGNYNTATLSYVMENNDAADNANTSYTAARRGTPPAWASGVVSVASITKSFPRQASTAPDGPFESLQFGLLAVDSFDLLNLPGLDMNASTTGVCSPCNARAIGTALKIRYGRLRLDGTSGPESVSLPVNFLSEYWSGKNFILNTNDSCTLVPLAAITYPSGTLATASNFNVPLSIGKTIGTYANSSGGVHFSAGTAGHFFSKPDLGGTGSFVVGVDLTTLAWLRYDWNQDGNFADTHIPNVPYAFGTYRGNDRIIYWHEKF